MEISLKWLYKRLVIWSIISLVVVDRVLKILATTQWAHTPLQLKSWLFFGQEINPGLAWGIASSTNGYIQIIFVIFMAIALLGIAYRGTLEWCAGNTSRNEILIFIGGLSNLIDRIQYGAVVDFVQIFIGNYRLSVFNLADVYIVVGLAFILKKAWVDGYF